VFKLPAEVEADGSFVADDGVRLLQGWVGGEEADVKVYVADGICFAGRKRFSASSYRTDEIVPVALDPETEGIVRAAGEALGLSCFGVDLRFDGEGPFIIDANPFPGYRGFPGAVGGVAGGGRARSGGRVSLRARNPRVAVATVIAEGFLGRLAFGMVSFALPLYAYSLGLSVGEIGLLVSLRTVLVLPLKPVAAGSRTVSGVRTVYTLGALARVVAAAVLLVSGGFWGLALVRVLQGQAPPGGR
jgi:hypothetical protein